MHIEWSLELDTVPSSEPVSLQEVKDHLRIDTSSDDDDLARKIAEARTWAEEFTRRSFMPTTWKLYLSAWPRAIQLFRAPLSSLTSITYIDTAGDSTVLDSSIFLTNAVAEPAIITEAWQQQWPSLRNNQYNSIIIEYIAGYANAASVPDPIKQAIKAKVASLYEFREDSISGQAVSSMQDVGERLLWPYRTFMEVPWL